ncbi:NAD(P)-dependent oxidoreductase [Actinacidiphila sp. ITFR-21]|uniref:NAD(P)-dependent oxidoreductase n=1 Tax=Actinacidiphila sp. ITFR-21 TaxID=3075199 RepID=UPI00288AD2C4|nr:NAD(P)-dependent oxidoreductase [Streptomyces sp. ITFR-21]WNI15593.1 NAD(P)-dependent oxidoreductase [Streptomyces sp. ITFR-21]
MARIGLVGVGRMGTPICANLVGAGHPVVAFDILPERERAVVSAGAQWRASAAEAAEGADVLITVLPGPAEAAATVTDSLLGALARGATWIDMTSNSPAAAAPVQERARAMGVGVLEAPVGGGPADAEAGTLRLFVGGDAELLARHRTLLTAVAAPDRIAHAGSLGTGYTLKLLVNMLWFGQAAATAEVLLLGRGAGIDLDVLHGTLADSAASSDFIRRDLPALFAGDYLRSFGLDHIHDQLAVVVDLARQLGTPHDIAETVRALHRQALERYGPVDGELLAVALLEERTGIRLRT